MISKLIRSKVRQFSDAFSGNGSRRRPLRGGLAVAAQVQPLEERALLSAAVYSVASAMNWGTTAPVYTTDVSYTSSGQWETLNVVNYSPSHYVDFNSSGQLTFSDGSVLGDTTFQTNLSTDSPYLSANPEAGQFVNYIQGNPQVLIYHDLAQLAAAGFDGVRLYAVGPQVEIATIMAANQLSQDLGTQFYVELEVYVPDLSQAQYYGGTVQQRIETLYNQEVAATPAGQPGLTEGGLQQLHYVINIVGANVFSKIVPLVFFGHEELVQPTSATGQALTDDNSSVPLLQWGINATRALLKQELAGQPLPSVTTALVAGQVVDVSTANHPEIAKLIHTIQTDTNAPIAYDVYAFQWANIYFDTTPSAYVNNSGVIANAYPPNAQYYDRTTGWTTGAPPGNPNFTVQDAVTNPNLMWSLQWMSERVNWIWGTPQGQGGVAKQLVAETGWASAQPYTQTATGGGAGKQVTGTHADAQAYFDAVKTAGFKIGSAPVMYFEAYDEPVKETNASMYSENHYGIYGWTAIPKFFTDTVDHPLTQPFAVVSIAPTNLQQNAVVQADTGKLPTDTAYTLKVTNGGTVKPGSTVNVPWFWGTGGFSDGNNLGNSVTWMPNPSVFLSNGDKLTITSADPNSINPAANYPASIQLTFNSSQPFASAVTDLNPHAAGENLVAPTNNYGAVGSSWQLFTSFPWLHGGSNNYQSTATFPPVYQDFWGSGAQMVRDNLMVSGTTGDDLVRIVPVNTNGNRFQWPFSPWSSPSTSVQVLVNGVSLGTFGPISGKIYLKGFDGNDTLIVDQAVRTAVVIDGGPGNDKIRGGRGNDLLIGGLGWDILIGGGGCDRLIDQCFANWLPVPPKCSGPGPTWNPTVPQMATPSISKAVAPAKPSFAQPAVAARPSGRSRWRR
ncbi:MAG: hypothetical protein ACT4QC_21040 [Planctomycetaceae bacterium]